MAATATPRSPCRPASAARTGSTSQYARSTWRCAVDTGYVACALLAGQSRGHRPVAPAECADTGTFAFANRAFAEARGVSRTLKEESCRRPPYRRNCARDGDLLALQRRPTGAGAKPPDAALAEDRRGERSGKGAVVIASGGDQEEVPEALSWGDLVGRALLRRRNSETASKPGVLASPSGSAWRIPVCWPGGARRRGDVSLVCGSCTEREKASDETGRPGLRAEFYGR